VSACTALFRCLVVLLIVGVLAKAMAAECDNRQLRLESSDMSSSQRIEMYGNLSTAPSYIKIKIRDATSKKTLNLVVENPELAGFMESEHIVTGACDYIEWMLRHENTSLDLNLTKFEDYLARKKFGSRSAAMTYLRQSIYEAPMTFQQLNVRDEDELIGKYFYFDKNQSIGSPKLDLIDPHDPRFIALLIDLGYVVSRGDVAPIMRIRKPREEAMRKQ